MLLLSGKSKKKEKKKKVRVSDSENPLQKDSKVLDVIDIVEWSVIFLFFSPGVLNPNYQTLQNEM